jgi:RNA recognition motif-containing protein
MDEGHLSKGFGYITYHNAEDAKMAVEKLQESSERTQCVAVAYKTKEP